MDDLQPICFVSYYSLRGKSNTNRENAGPLNSLPVFWGVSKLPMLPADGMGGLPLHRYVILCAILPLYVILGRVLDGIAMIVLTIPSLFPVVTALNFVRCWKFDLPAMP